jgi:predicted type IV restriction endonuclease
VSLSDVDEGMTVEGKIDILVLKEHFWVVVIESKRASFSIEAGLAQLLSYMLANPHHNHKNFGLITTGGSFVFVKLVARDVPQYALSRIFEQRNPGNDLYAVLSVLKQFRRLFSGEEIA